MHLSVIEMESLLTEVPGPTLSHLLMCSHCRRRVAELVHADLPLLEPIVSRSLAQVFAKAISAVEDGPSEEELLKGYELSSELLAFPKESQLQAAAQRGEFHSPALAEVLLRTAEEKGEDPQAIRLLAGLAETVLDHLSESTRARELRAKSSLLLARAARLEGLFDLADDFLAAMRHALRDHPLDHPLRISLCLEGGLLYRDRGSLDEAIALLERASLLASDLRRDGELAEARLSLGRLYLEEEDFEGALVPLREAQELLEGERSERTISCWEALALVLAELGDDQQAGELVARSEELAEDGDVDPLRVLWMRARVEARGPRSTEALALLTSVFERILSEGRPEAQAALAGLELAILAIEIEPPEGSGPLIESIAGRLEALPPAHRLPHFLPVLHFAFGLAVARRGAYVDALLSARCWVEKARFNPKLPYHPLSEPDEVVRWERLSLEQRLLLADRALPLELAGRLRSHPGSSGFFRLLTRGQLDLLTWMHEALTGIRVQLPEDLMEDTRVA